MNDLPPNPAAPRAPRIIPRAEHTVSRTHLSPNALRVLYRLKDAGFQAFLVGGCVRDVLLGLEPKDFDVATNAQPEEVRSLFRNCRLIGRRFRLAHVVFGREIIEVATFRASGAPDQGEEPAEEGAEEAELDAEIDAEDDESDADDTDEGESDEDDEEEEEEDEDAEDATAELPSRGHSGERVLDSSGRILRDNVYGSIDDDVWRRDFTANSLYYNIADYSIWDYTGGMEDVVARRLRLIGDPETRYREDPVRMLRAARFEAKLGFELAPATVAPIAPLRNLLAGVPAARLFDEMLKLFLTGHGERSFEVLQHHGLLEVLLPSLGSYLRRYPGGAAERLLHQGLRNTDSRVVLDKPVTPTFLFALLLYGPIALQIESMPPQRWHEPAAILEACDRVLREVHQRVTIPKRFAFGIRDMYALQPRLERPRGKSALRMLEQPRFRAAYDLLLLRAGVGLAAADVAAWWTHLQEVGPEERQRQCDALPQQGSAAAASEGGEPRRSRRPRRRRRKSSRA
ncbi:MAG: polynucleotide adenylyltransferase PcnB [Steroidobacteraceae bacterium]